jgi:hypothetical protein
MIVAYSVSGSCKVPRQGFQNRPSSRKGASRWSATLAREAKGIRAQYRLSSDSGKQTLAYRCPDVSRLYILTFRYS